MSSSKMPRALSRGLVALVCAVAALHSAQAAALSINAAGFSATHSSAKPAAPGEAGIAAMVAAMPADQRAAAEQQLRSHWQKYRQLEQALKAPEGDPGVAVAAYVMAHWKGYTGELLMPWKIAAIAKQGKAALESNPTFAKLSEGQRQALVEQIALIGMAMKQTADLAQMGGADATQLAQLREASRRGLAQLLGADPSRMSVTDAGVVIQ